MKECPWKKVLKGKKSHNDPPYPSRSSVGPGGQRDQEHGVVLHVQEEGYQLPQTSRTESSKVPQGLSMTLLPTKADRWTLRSRTWGSSTMISHSYPNPVLNRTESRTKYQSLGLTLLNARSSFQLIFCQYFQLYNPPKKSVPKGWRHKAGGCSAEVKTVKTT